MNWLSSPIATLIGLVTGFIGIGVAIVLYFKSKRDKGPSWAIRTVNLFQDYAGSIKGLEIQYNGEKVKNLSVSKILFWNKGALTIDKTDLADADPLRLEAQGKARILGAMLVSVNNHASRPLLTLPMENSVIISFDYLDRGQGFVIQAIHEGTSSTDLQIKGAIKGAVKIAGYNLGDLRPVRKTDSVIAWIASLVAIGFLVDIVTDLWKFWHNDIYNDLIFPATLMLLLPFSMLFGVFFYLYRYRWVPRGLEIFNLDDAIHEHDKVEPSSSNSLR